LIAQHDRAALVQSEDVERVLADINADYGDRGGKLLESGGVGEIGVGELIDTGSREAPIRLINA